MGCEDLTEWELSGNNGAVCRRPYVEMTLHHSTKK